LGLRGPQGPIAGSFSSRRAAGSARQAPAISKGRTPSEYESPLPEHKPRTVACVTLTAACLTNTAASATQTAANVSEAAASVTQAAVSKCSLSRNLACCQMCKHRSCHLKSITCNLVPLGKTQSDRVIATRAGHRLLTAGRRTQTTVLQPLSDSFIVKKECLRKQELRCKTPRR